MDDDFRSWSMIGAVFTHANRNSTLIAWINTSTQRSMCAILLSALTAFAYDVTHCTVGYRKVDNSSVMGLRLRYRLSFMWSCSYFLLLIQVFFLKNNRINYQLFLFLADPILAHARTLFSDCSAATYSLNQEQPIPIPCHPGWA